MPCENSLRFYFNVIVWRGDGLIMRIRLKLLLDKPMVCLEYRKAFMHYLKSSLSGLEGVDAYDEFYSDEKIAKEFTFAIKLNQPKFQKNVIELGGNIIEVNISTANIKKALILNNAFAKIMNKKCGFGEGNNVALTGVHISEGKKVCGEEIIIKMMSPLCIREHIKGKSDFYYSVAHSEFSEKATQIIKEQIKYELGISECELTIEGINNKKTVVQHYEQKLEVSIGEFRLQGNRDVLQYLYENGIGSRKSAGFGMFEIL